MHLHLDLESTLIHPVLTGWSNFDPIFEHIEKIKPYVAAAATINIFSFAIHDNTELAGFNKYVRPWLENNLGKEIVDVPTIQTMTADIQRRRNIKYVTFKNLIDFYGKAGTFMQLGYQGDHTLIDDDVPDMTVHTLNALLIIKNVDNL